jgi:hypothetical protein
LATLSPPTNPSPTRSECNLKLASNENDRNKKLLSVKDEKLKDTTKSLENQYTMNVAFKKCLEAEKNERETYDSVCADLKEINKKIGEELEKVKSSRNNDVVALNVKLSAFEIENAKLKQALEGLQQQKTGGRDSSAGSGITSGISVVKRARTDGGSQLPGSNIGGGKAESYSASSETPAPKRSRSRMTIPTLPGAFQAAQAKCFMCSDKAYGLMTSCKGPDDGSGASCPVGRKIHAACSTKLAGAPYRCEQCAKVLPVEDDDDDEVEEEEEEKGKA